MQDSSTGEMVFSVAELIAFITQGITLEPGDVVLTGTPHGVGNFRDPQVFLQPGDVVEVEVGDLGVLTNTVGPHFDKEES
jgi:2-keto-4-pentenoate hydratase/2-oxohepta-3-ene-1,7-dioic acid hydratase in catechol pathway